MRENLPVTAAEFELSSYDVIITHTDLDGRILYANDAFLKASGYALDEVIGQPQNLIRHPDMPARAFEDLWRTIRAGRPWAGIVKNRRKDGGFYWVAANVTPVFEAGVPTGYMSVRTKPSPEQVRSATRVYAQLQRRGRARLRLAGGEVIRTGVRGVIDRLLRLPVTLRLWSVMVALMVMMVLQVVAALQTLPAGAASRWLAWLPGCLGVPLACASGFYLTRRILLPLRSLNETAVGVLCGRIEQRFAEQGDEQIRLLASMLNQMNAKLVGTLIDTRLAIDVIRDATGALASGNADLAQRTEEQASAIEETTASLVGVTQTAEGNAADSERADAASRDTAEAALVASQEARRTVEAMAQVRAHSRRIGEITSVIDGIAFQTNIIALNASVEAARAGQHGRGFAVVAAEVRNLAQKAAVAAGEIKGLIDSELESVGSAVQAATRAGETMTTVQTAVTQLADTVREIARESRGQSAQIAQIAQIGGAVEHVSDLTQRNAALVEHTAAASLALQNQTQLLDTAVSVFHFGEAQRA